MRTKTLVLTALLGIAASPLFAQTNVYSVNAVGYVQVSFPASQLVLIANPLNTTNNTIGSLFGANTPDGTTLYKWTGSTYTIATYASFLGGWFGQSGSLNGVSLNPGEGAFVSAASPFTNTFVGEVLQGSLTNGIPPGYSIRGSQVPQAGDANALNLSAALTDGDIVYKWLGNKYDIYTRASFLPNGWGGGASGIDAPVIGVGEAFFVYAQNGGNWTRSFSVNN